MEDRIAQMIVRNELEPKLDSVFVDDSYGYRPKKSAHQALAATRERCWKYDWVIDMDIKGFFDNIDHELLLKAVYFHKPPVWVRLYIERWLKAKIIDDEGRERTPDKGTPQGGVISPLLANLYLHYTFDLWMKRNSGHVLFERYADDVVIHCRSRIEAEYLLEAIVKRFDDCKLTVHPVKTKIVYCKDAIRNDDFVNTEFDFLGYTFKSRFVKSRKGRYFMGFTPAISKASEKAIKREIRKWKLYKRTDVDIFYISKKYNPKLRGWFNYFGRFRTSELIRIFKMFQKILAKWAKSKYKRFKGYWRYAYQLIETISQSEPQLFVHWKHGWNFQG